MRAPRAGFDIEIGYHNRSEKNVPYRYFDRVDTLAQWADFLIVATPGGAGTRHLIDRAVLDALGLAGSSSTCHAAALSIPLLWRTRCVKDASRARDVYEGEPEPPR